MKKKSFQIAIEKTNVLIQDLSERLYEQFKNEKRTIKYAAVKEVLALLGKGILLPALFIAPGIGKAFKNTRFSEKEFASWKKFNTSYLRRTITKLENQKYIEKTMYKGREIIQITESGKKRVLKFALDSIEIKRPRWWDGKWRMIIYDIPQHKKGEQEFFRRKLKDLNCCQFQKSVFLYPFACEEEIEYLRSFLGIREYVRIVTITSLENDKIFRDFFGLQ